MQKQERYPSCSYVNWNFKRNNNGLIPFEDVKMILLMDIRNELQKINQTLSCRNTLEIPSMLRRIAKNTTKKKVKKGKK